MNFLLAGSGLDADCVSILKGSIAVDDGYITAV
jgi:hypothetical protein